MGIIQRKAIVFTGARSEYGLLKPLIRELLYSTAWTCEVVVGGSHLSEKHGLTINEIKSDNVPIARTINNFIEHDDSDSLCISNANLQIQFSEFLCSYAPDIVIILGDRSELLPIASTCLFHSIPVAHISGGEITEGSTDNQVRHAVSKMSHIHFTSTEIYKQNLMKMGEEEWRICVSGEPGLDDILLTPIPSEEEFRLLYNLPVQQKIILSTFHSETIFNSIDNNFIEELVDAICKRTDYHLLFTAANSDLGGQVINNTLDKISSVNKRVTFIPSLGKTNYYAAQRYCHMMLGNSSSGLVEAQSFGLPVINVGNRQKGRIRNPNVIDTSLNVLEIIEALGKASDEEFRLKFQNQPNLYGDGTACKRIVNFLETINWSSILQKKSIF